MKTSAITGAEVGVIGVGMISSRKWLDAKEIFAKKIAADPNFYNTTFGKIVTHQGAAKFVLGSLAAGFIPNKPGIWPWLRLLAIGIAGEGFLGEAGLLSTKKDGTRFFSQIGNPNSNEALDEELLAASRALQTSGITNRYQNQVSGITNQYQSQVSGMGNYYDLDLQQSAVSGAGMGMGMPTRGMGMPTR